MNEMVRVRPALPGDIETIVVFNQGLARETEGMELDADTLRRGVANLLGRPERGRYFVAEIDAEPVGQLMHTYDWSDWRDGEIWWIQSVYVSKSFRGKGVYRRLHEHLRNEAREVGSQVVGIRLYVEKENHAARGVYERMGMKIAPYDVMQEIFTAGGR